MEISARCAAVFPVANVSGAGGCIHPGPEETRIAHIASRSEYWSRTDLYLEFACILNLFRLSRVLLLMSLLVLLLLLMLLLLPVLLLVVLLLVAVLLLGPSWG